MDTIIIIGVILYVLAILFVLACVVIYIVDPSTETWHQPRIQPDLDKAFPVHYESPVVSAPPQDSVITPVSLTDEQLRARIEEVYTGRYNAVQPLNCRWVTNEKQILYRGLAIESIDMLIDAIMKHCPETWKNIVAQKEKSHDLIIWRGLSASQIDLLIDAANESAHVILTLFNCGFPVLGILKPVKTNPLLDRPQNPNLDIIRRHFN